MDENGARILTVFLGAGGVGKTTLAAAYALSAAKSGRKVGLLSIDPARRLKTALGCSGLSEIGSRLPLPFETSGELVAALLTVEDCLKRWVMEQGLCPEDEKKLLEHVFFRALGERLATASDTFAAVRLAEWIEQFPEVEELVVDTAPGIHAVDFLVRPDRLMEFFDSRIVDWIKWAVDGGEHRGLISGIFRSGTRRVLDGLASLGGRNFLVSFGELLSLLDQVVLTMSRRLTTARSWLRHSSTQFCLVCSVREDSVAVARELAGLLRKLDIQPHSAILNRAVSHELRQDPGFVKFLQECGGTGTIEERLGNYARNYLACQNGILGSLGQIAPQVVELPVAPGLDGLDGMRLVDLALLGDLMRSRMSASHK